MIFNRVLKKQTYDPISHSNLHHHHHHHALQGKVTVIMLSLRNNTKCRWVLQKESSYDQCADGEGQWRAMISGECENGYDRWTPIYAIIHRWFINLMKGLLAQTLPSSSQMFRLYKLCTLIIIVIIVPYNVPITPFIISFWGCSHYKRL